LIELQLKIIEILVKSYSEANLLSFMKACRGFYVLGLPELMRELVFPLESKNDPEGRKREAAFLQDGLQSDKFRFVRSLGLLSQSDTPNQLEILRRTASRLEKLTLAVNDVEKDGPALGRP
jgi:hypothetical protein